MESLNRADIEFILTKEEKKKARNSTHISTKPWTQQTTKGQSVCESHFKGKTPKIGQMSDVICCYFEAESSNSEAVSLDRMRQLNFLFSCSRVDASMNSQERGRPEPGGDWLHSWPFLLIDKAQEVFFGASSLVFPEDAVLTTETNTKTQSYIISSLCWAAKCTHRVSKRFSMGTNRTKIPHTWNKFILSEHVWGKTSGDEVTGRTETQC